MEVTADVSMTSLSDDSAVDLFQHNDDVDSDGEDFDSFWQLLGQLQDADNNNNMTSPLELMLTSFNASSDAGGFGGIGQRRPVVSDTFKTVVDGLNLYVTPVIVVVGVVGNALSLAVFSLTHLQRLSSSLYLSLVSVCLSLHLADNPDVSVMLQSVSVDAVRCRYIVPSDVARSLVGES